MTLGNFVTSTMGMLSQSHALGQISSNIANVNTVGYKKVETLFQTQMTQYKDKGTDNHLFSAGTVDRRMVDIAGLTTTTSSIYDLAISGRGFFVVEKDGQQLYSRAGDFMGTAIPPAGYSSNPINFYEPQGAGVVTQDASANYLMNASGLYVMGWNAHPETGAFSSSLEPVIISPPKYYPGAVTTKMELKGNIASNATEVQKLSFPVYDHQYNAQSMVMLWEPAANANTWDLNVSIEGATVTTTPSEIRFNNDAQLVEPQPGVTVQVQWADGTSSTIAVDLTHMTQYSTALLGEVKSQDGKAFGELVSRSWDSNGVLKAYYTNGSVTNVCKVAVAQVQVPNMMEAVSGNMFAYNAKAGELDIVDLEETPGRSTEVLGGTLEGSNVLLEDEFTRMIITQRAYSGNVKSFTTGNEMMQEAISILG